MTQLPRVPDLEAQRAAMKKLGFLVGDWAGTARIFRGADTMELQQTESAQYKLDGLILLIEGIGIDRSTKKPALQALGFVSYDDESATYRMRAFNDGRFLETELRLQDEGQRLAWGFTLGEIRTKSVLWIDEKGDWIESHEL